MVQESSIHSYNFKSNQHLSNAVSINKIEARKLFPTQSLSFYGATPDVPRAKYTYQKYQVWSKPFLRRVNQQNRSKKFFLKNSKFEPHWSGPRRPNSQVLISKISSLVKIFSMQYQLSKSEKKNFPMQSLSPSGAGSNGARANWS